MRERIFGRLKLLCTKDEHVTNNCCTVHLLAKIVQEHGSSRGFAQGVGDARVAELARKREHREECDNAMPVVKKVWPALA